MIINETKWQLPEYIQDVFTKLCNQANISCKEITCVVKRHKKYRGDCWAQRGNPNIPSGLMDWENRRVVIRIGHKTHEDDFRFVLAHEIGHYKQYKEAGKLESAGDYQKMTKACKPETYATQFALACNCYPHSQYRGIKSKCRNNVTT